MPIDTAVVAVRAAHPEPALALDRRVGAAGLVGDVKPVSVLAGRPGALPGSGRGRARGVGGTNWWRRGGVAGVSPSIGGKRPQRSVRRPRRARPGSLPRWRGIRPRRSEPGERLLQPPELEAGPALAAVGMPEATVGVDRHREVDAEARLRGRPPHGAARLGAEREAGGLDADRGQPVLARAWPTPRQVGQGADAVQAGRSRGSGPAPGRRRLPPASTSAPHRT